MLKWIAATARAVVLLGTSLLFASLPVMPSALAASAPMQAAHASHVTDFSARRHHHHHLYVYHPYYPYYHGYPYYYSPGPFLLPWFDDSDRE